MAGQSPASFKGLWFIPCLLLSVFLRLVQCMYVTDLNSVNGLRIDLMRTDFLLDNISPTERLKRAVERSQNRLEKLQMSVLRNADVLNVETESVQTPINAGSGEFLIEVSIGSPALSYFAIMDTGSDLIWTQCKPCVGCYKQPTAIFDPSSSSTYSNVPCNSSLCQGFYCSDAECKYNYNYGDYSFTKGILGYETFTLSSQSLPNIAFGCSQDSEGQGFKQAAGLVGFGRGPLSLNSQLGKSIGNKFSYCLMSVSDSPSKTSPLFIGQTASLTGSNVMSTPIIQSSSNPSYYYLFLKGISIGGKFLDIPPGTFDLQGDGSGGFIIDSGTTITYLQQAAYEAVYQALAIITLPQTDPTPYGLDLCYRTNGSSNVRFPTMIFHFQGADYRVTQQNYMMDFSGGIICLAMLPTSSDMAILGNVLQQNYHILYDIEQNVLSFERTVCDAL